MRPTYFVSVGVLLVGCIEPRDEELTTTAQKLVIEPADVTVFVLDGKPYAQTFKATMVDEDGDARDVTAETTFVLLDGTVGTWNASTLSVSGATLGPTRVLAGHDGQQANATITVYARNDRYVGVPAGAAKLFAGATENTACGPGISYPQNNVVMAKNAGVLDVQWADPLNDMFEVSFATTYAETRIYTRRARTFAHDASEFSAWTALAGDDLSRLAEQHEPITVRVSGLVESDPFRRCVAPAQRVFLTDQPLAGRFFMMNEDGVYRADAATPLEDPARMISADTWNTQLAPELGNDVMSCSGCSVSPDGNRLAIAGSKTGVIYEFDHEKVWAPANSWTFSTYNASGTKLVTSTPEGDLHVISEAGTVLGKLDSKPYYQAIDPQLSPDGRWLANVEATSSSMFVSTTIVLREFFDGGNEMGASTEIVPFEPGAANYYPAWSPDGQWLVFTRATKWGTADVSAAIWIVRADGTQPAIQLTPPAKILDIRARVVPAMMSVGGEPIFFVVYESRDAYGEQLAAGRVQLWAMPFFPERALESAGPCSPTSLVCTPSFRAPAPSIRLPMQPLSTNNRLIQWLRPTGA